MMQAEIKWTQRQANKLGDLLSDHRVRSAVLIFECEDGSRSHLTLLDIEDTPDSDSAQRAKNVTALTLAKSMIGEIESGGARTIAIRQTK